MRTLALVDGEHYPPVTRAALEAARERGHEIVAALLVGGTEKLAAGDVRPTSASRSCVMADERMHALRAAIAEHSPGGRPRPLRRAGPRLSGADGARRRSPSRRGLPTSARTSGCDPPEQGPPLRRPTLAVIGTGKRTGKTAIAGAVARLAARRGLEPVVVAMGRGGPPEPTVAEAGSRRPRPPRRPGRRAASTRPRTTWRTRMTTGVTTVGARRAGGGLAGAPYVTNVREAAELAAALGPGLVILEGSGAAIPPVPWDAGILVVPATAPPEYLGGYLGPYRLLLSDLVVVTMAGDPIRVREPFRAPFPRSALPGRCARSSRRTSSRLRWKTCGARKRSSPRLHLRRSPRG